MKYVSVAGQLSHFILKLANGSIPEISISKLCSSGKTLLIGHINTLKRQNRDLILDTDVTKELKNTLPDVKKIPFELKEDEAILSYKLGDKINYFKIEDIEKVKPVFFPRANKG